jgi:hypothetical protein
MTTAKRSKKMPAALLEHFAAMKAKRVELNGKTIKPGKRRARVLKATRAAVKKAAPGTRHAAVRFNPMIALASPPSHFAHALRAAVRDFGIAGSHVREDRRGGVSIYDEELLGDSAALRRRITAVARDHGFARNTRDEGDGEMIFAPPGKRARNPHTFKDTGRVSKVENVRGLRSAKYLMRKAAEAKREGKEFHGDVTKKGTHRTVRMASARLMGFTADKPAKPREAKAAGATKGTGLMEDSLAAMGAY